MRHNDYIRVIPRDLFNEANLLKCLGQLYIALENLHGQHRAKYAIEDVERFDIHQSPDDGSIYVANLPFMIDGRIYHLSRPLNSRQPWPLYATLSWPQPGEEQTVTAVFTDEGKLSAEFLKLIFV